MDSWAKIIAPIIVTILLASVIGLYQRVSDLEKYTMGRAILEYRLNRLEKKHE